MASSIALFDTLMNLLVRLSPLPAASAAGESCATYMLHLVSFDSFMAGHGIPHEWVTTARHGSDMVLHGTLWAPTNCHRTPHVNDLGDVPDIDGNAMLFNGMFLHDMP